MPIVKRPKKMDEYIRAPYRPIATKVIQRIVENFKLFPSFAWDSRRVGRLKSFCMVSVMV